MHEWVEEFPGAVTVCDREGVILAMNDRSAASFGKEGGRELIGRNLIDCHPEPAKSKVRGMLASGKHNAYTIEKNGVWKLIYQAPWYEKGEYRGFVEFALEIPETLPHFIRS